VNVLPIKTAVFSEGDNLFAFITTHLKSLAEGSVLVVTSKIVSLAEGRTEKIIDENTKIALILKESDDAIPTKYAWLTVKDGVLMASAGIDESNANGKLIMLPKDSFAVARQLRKALKQHYGVSRLGVLITDSRTLPLRAGVMGVALGYAGFKGIKDYRGKKDLFGRPFHFSRVDVADSLATSAVLVMGEGSEQCPLAVITEAPVVYCERVQRKELFIELTEDMYRPYFDHLSS